MNGLELAARLKEMSPETPVILCTAFTENSYLLKAIELGVVALVRKPLDMDELLKKIGAATAHIIQQYEINTAKTQRTQRIS